MRTSISARIEHFQRARKQSRSPTNRKRIQQGAGAMKRNFKNSPRNDLPRQVNNHWCAVTCLGICTLVIAIGCDSGPKLIPISGRVTIDGKPLEMGAVTVWVKDYRPSYGMIDKDGRFELMTHKPGDGCPVGEFPVTVTSETASKADVMTYFVPMRYKDPAQSKLSILVEQPRNDWEIELTWKGDPHGGTYSEK
jgi:hypothetical protein